MLQWPEDFDFEATRAINRPAHAQESAKHVEPSREDSVDEKKRESTEVSVEPMSEDAAAAEEERELDPVALNKACRLAVWSSVILVRASRHVSH